MKKAFKVIAVILGVLVILVGGLALAGQVLSDRKMNRTVAVTVAAVAPAGDAAALARGKYLFESRGCMECHGRDGHGGDVIDDGAMFVHAPNITGGKGGVTAQYAAEDWVRTIRHGVKPSGKPVLIMPSEDYNRLTDEDLAALVGYVRSLPPVQGRGAELLLPLPVKALYAFGVVKDAAEKIDHGLPPSKPVPAAVNAEHGAYVANACIGCHGPGLSGGKIPGGPPDWPAAANLTPGRGSAMVRYDTPEKFRAMLRTGKRPDGSEVSRVMPFRSLGSMDDTDAGALYAFLKSVAPRDAGNR
ncbi:MAG TPA: c-type cytochrome [Burkholderiales bacterium]|nr:c-type cytochrome [Burkholderiales bacterium]